MKLKALKTGYSVKVGDREGLHFTDQAERSADSYEIEIVPLDSYFMSVVQIKNKRTGRVAWTSFSNVVYAEPMELEAREVEGVESVSERSIEPVERKTRTRKPKADASETKVSF